MKYHLSYLKRTGRFPQNSSLKLTTRHLKMKMNITLSLGVQGGGPNVAIDFLLRG